MSAPGTVPEDFELLDWLVQPSLNRLVRGARVVSIEPRQMDLLAFLAAQAGAVASKDAIADAVWRQKFYSEWVISRAVAALRRALGDDAKSPRFIETISQRGYRLIPAAVRRGADASPAPAPPAVTGPAGHLPKAAVPRTASGEAAAFCAGRWVRGGGFVGRTALIGELLAGPRAAVWLLGTRQIGKTSLLRQLEHVCQADPSLGLVPLFWDLQGAGTPAGLARDLAAVLEDAEERLAAAGVALEPLHADDVFSTLGRLRRALRSRGLTLLLLLDEAEELIALGTQNPSLLPRLRRALQSHDEVRSVLAASARLWALAGQAGDTSPFLHGFTPPEYLGALSDDEARALLAPAAARLGPADIEAAREACGNHPYLLHVVGRRLLDGDDAAGAVEAVAAEPAVALLCASDDAALSDDERFALDLVARERPSRAALDAALTARSATAPGCVPILERKGLLAREAECPRIANVFLARWLLARS